MTRRACIGGFGRVVLVLVRNETVRRRTGRDRGLRVAGERRARKEGAVGQNGDGRRAWERAVAAYSPEDQLRMQQANREPNPEKKEKSKNKKVYPCMDSNHESPAP